MKIEKLNNNSYRMRKMYKGKTYTVITDYKPTQKEALELITKEMNMITIEDSKGMTFLSACKAYIELKSNILSPSTKRGYFGIIKVIPESFKAKRITDIDNVAVQKIVNDYAKNHAPKSTRNYYSFIRTIISTYNPNIVLKCNLPQLKKSDEYIPTIEDVKRLYEAINGTEYEVLFKLAGMGLRRSEICALTMDDINENVVTINKALVENENKEWIIKSTKTTESERTIIVPDSLALLIKEKGLYTGKPTSIDKILKRYLKKLDIHPFGIHKLRHFFVSYAHDNGFTDAQIMEMGGWSTPYVMKSVYRHALNQKEAKEKMASSIKKLF